MASLAVNVRATEHEKSDIGEYEYIIDEEYELDEDLESLTYLLPEIMDFEAVSNFRTTPMVSAGNWHTVALRNDGTVWTWGRNDSGQLGNGSTANRHTPVRVQGLSDVIAVSAGSWHTMALRSDGTVWAWGSNIFGQLGQPLTTYSRSTPVQVRGLIDIIAISAGGQHNVALRNDGTVWAWGNNTAGQLGYRTIVGNRPAPAQVQGLSGITAIDGGSSHTIALQYDGTVWVWGNIFRTSSIGDAPVQVQGLNNVTAIAGGGYHNIALRNDGMVWTWGNNFVGELGDGTTTNRLIPMQVQGLDNVTTIAGGGSHTIIIRSDDTIWAWGNNSHGQLGDGNTVSHLTPTQINELNNARYIAGGGSHTVVLRNDGTVWTLGRNVEGQLGAGTTNVQNVPVQVLGLDGIGYLNLLTSSPPTDPNRPIHELSIEVPRQETFRVGATTPNYRGTVTINLHNGGVLLDLGGIGEAPPERLPVDNVRVHITLPRGVTFAETNFPIRETTISPGEVLERPNYYYIGLVTQNAQGLYETVITFDSILPRRFIELSFDIELSFSDLNTINLGDIEYAITADSLPQQRHITTLNVHRAELTQLARLFSYNSFIYNHDLAILGVELSAIAYGRDGSNSRPEPIYNSLRELGFSRIIQRNYHEIQRPNHHIVGYTFAHQKIEINGVLRPVVFVVIRGTTGDDQWHSNFTIGHRYEHYGFSRAEQELHAELYDYLMLLKRHDLYNAEDGIIFITGHSRGAGVANLLAHHLNRTEVLVLQENLYAYTFATPNTTQRAIEYQNIFNFINAEDFVAYLPLYVGWGFWRHGRTFAFPSRGLVSPEIFIRHRYNVTAKYRNLTGGSPLFRRSGINHVINITSQFHRIAPTVWDFYNTSHWAGFPITLTPVEFMSVVASAAAGDPAAKVALLGISGTTATANRYASIAQFLVYEAWLNVDSIFSPHDNPHDENLYRAWIHAISETDLIEHLFFEYEIFGRTIRIACPVDVSIYDSNNRLVGRVLDKVADDTIESDIFIIVIDDVKYVHVSAFETYTIRFIATDTGTMTYTIEDVEILTLRTIERKEFENVAL